MQENSVRRWAGGATHRFGGRVRLLALASAIAVVTAVASGSADGRSAHSSRAAAATASCMAKAKQVVNSAEAPAQIKTPSKSIQATKLKGKLVYYVSIPSGYSERLWVGFSAAAKAAGLKPIFGAGNTPQDWNASIQQAVARHAAGIEMMAITPSLVQSSLAQAKAAHIPVINQNSIPPAATDITSTVQIPVGNLGKIMAADAALDQNCKVNALFGQDPTFSGTVAIGNAVNAELQQLCPTTCKSNPLNISVATMATQAVPALQSALERDPRVNAVIGAFDSLTLIFESGLAASGSKAKLYGNNGDTANLALVRKGLQASDYAYVPTDSQGYVNLDLLMRAMLKHPIKGPQEQVQLFTSSNIPKSASMSKMWPDLAGFRTKFLKLWGFTK